MCYDSMCNIRQYICVYVAHSVRAIKQHVLSALYPESYRNEVLTDIFVCGLRMFIRLVNLL